MPRRLGLLFVLILLLAGCGSAEVTAEKSRTTRPAALARKQDRTSFRDEAKATCAGLHRKLVHLQKRPGADRVLVEVADAWEATLAKLRRLDPPQRDRRRFRQMLVYFGRAVRAAKAVGSTEGEMVLAPIAAMLDQGGRGATIAQSLGLLSCSAVPPAPTRQELERWRKQMEQAARKQFAQLPGPGQPTHPLRVRPRVEPSTRP
jgi:hypothetical protein